MGRHDHISSGSGIALSYTGNTWTIANSIGYPFTISEKFATSTAATTTSISTQGVFFASSTAATSVFPFASTTALSAITLCLTGDTCRTTWPTSGGGSDPFTHQSYAGLTTSATTSTLWLTGATVSLAASSSILTFASSTAFTVSNSAYFATTGGSVGIGTTTPGSLFSIQSIANFQTGTSTLYNNLNVQGQLKVGTGSIYLNGAATSTFTAGVQSLLFFGSGASLTSLNASNLTSGTVGTARLGSGTANSSTYLRGDNHGQRLQESLQRQMRIGRQLFITIQAVLVAATLLLDLGYT